VSDLPRASIPWLTDLDVWIVDALRQRPHPSHFSVPEAIAWISRLGPRRAVLTHLHNELDYATLKRDLPEPIEPAYDGMTIDFEP
jgi:phosphoribosyl 1,2-cyclic phosphate phosphodiesterase